MAALNKKILAAYHNDVFIETGTGHGEGVKAALASGFVEIHSIEADKKRFDTARQMFATEPSVTIYFGSSEDILESVLRTIDCPVTFWLDAVTSYTQSSQGAISDTISPAPIIQELSIIAAHPVRTHTILINNMEDYAKGLKMWHRLTDETVIETMTKEFPKHKFSYGKGGHGRLIYVLKPTVS